MTRTFGLSIRETASLAPASGRHRKTMSAAFRNLRRSLLSCRLSSSIRISSRSSLAPIRSKICSPVVPLCPSIYTFVLLILFLIPYENRTCCPYADAYHNTVWKNCDGKTEKKKILAWAAGRQRGCFRGSLVGGLAAPALFCCWSAAVTGQLPGGACGARG